MDPDPGQLEPGTQASDSGGCLQRLLTLRLGEVWPQALTRPGQGTKTGFGWEKRAGLGPGY